MIALTLPLRTVSQAAPERVQFSRLTLLEWTGGGEAGVKLATFTRQSERHPVSKSFLIRIRGILSRSVSRWAVQH